MPPAYPFGKKSNGCSCQQKCRHNFRCFHIPHYFFWPFSIFGFDTRASLFRFPKMVRWQIIGHLFPSPRAQWKSISLPSSPFTASGLFSTGTESETYFSTQNFLWPLEQRIYLKQRLELAQALPMQRSFYWNTSSCCLVNTCLEPSIETIRNKVSL